MASEVDICNMALGNIRGPLIESLEPKTLPAQSCKLRYPILRDRMLAGLAWNFNRVIAPLELLGEEIFNWAYAYQYPTDCLKILRLIGSQEELSNTTPVSLLADPSLLPANALRVKIPYEVFNSTDHVIAANHASLRVEYAKRVTDPSLFPPDFVMALSHLLASEIAVQIVGAEVGRQLRSDSVSMYREYLAAAQANDANQQYHDAPLGDLELIRR